MLPWQRKPAMIDDIQSLDEESSMYVSVGSFHCFTPHIVCHFSTSDINKVNGLVEMTGLRLIPFIPKK